MADSYIGSLEEREDALDKELAEVLMAISVISKRLSKKIIEKKEKEDERTDKTDR